MAIRLDFVFSYWIFAWYLAYMAKLTPYNPKLALILGLIENILMAILFLLNGDTLSSMYPAILINIVIKVIPLFTVYKITIVPKDIYATIGLFAIYLLWLQLNGKSIIGLFKKTLDSILHNKNETPAMCIISKIHKYL
jgi:hypothetical protein